MDDLKTILASMPPGANLFDYLSAYIDEQVYPELGRPFYIQCYIIVALCCVVMTLLILGLYIRWRKERFNFFVIDGSATRPNPKVVVPILWCIEGALIIVLAFCIRSGSLSKRRPYAMGVFWWMLATGLIDSYAVVATSVMCSAPAIRKYLSQLDRRHKSFGGFAPSFIVLNASLLFICIASTATTYVAGRLQGLAFNRSYEGHTAAQQVIAQAKAQQSIALLASLPGAAAKLVQGRNYIIRAQVVGGAIYTAYIIVAFLTGLIPTVFLNLYMRKRIARLEKDLHSASMQTASLQEDTVVPLSRSTRPGALSEPDVLKPHLYTNESMASLSLPKLPKDRPFTNLASSSELPPNYAVIFESDANPRDKALRLKAALRRDNIQLIAYFLMLASYMTLTLFQLCGGASKYTSRELNHSSYSWQAWSYLVPAIILAGSALHDAIHNTNDDKEVADLQAASFASRKFTAPPIASIQLSQIVEVVEEYQMDEKKIRWKRTSLGDGHDC